MIHNDKNRNEIVDILRGFSILLVVLLHIQLRVPYQETWLFKELPEQLWFFFFQNGNAGVRIFFVISGFLITSTSLKRWGALENIDYIKFYKFRFARIAPLLILLLAVLGVLHYAGVDNYVINPNRASFSRSLLAAVTFHINWLEGQVGYLPANWDVLWSLSVEEVFYIFFPLICLWAPQRLLPIALLLFVLIGPFYRIMTSDNSIWSTKAYLSCMDSIAIGCLTAILVSRQQLAQKYVKYFLSLGIFLIITVLLFRGSEIFKPVNQKQLDETLISFGVAFVLIASVQIRMGQSLLLKLLQPISIYGRRSYEIYLTHMFIVFSIVDFFKFYSIEAPFVLAITIVILCGKIGYAIEKYFSEPMNKWLRGITTDGSAS